MIELTSERLSIREIAADDLEPLEQTPQFWRLSGGIQQYTLLNYTFR